LSQSGDSGTRLDRYQPRLFAPNLTAKEAEKWITALKAEIELANSF
jgi:hypothetical protein